ncbi:MAG: hypothetical protein Tsb0013_19640 [Phycisphaerales bacterium]
MWSVPALGQSVGACCLNDTGACLVATEANCTGPLNGTWMGSGMSCADDTPCTTTWGACCGPDECIVAPSFVCAALGEGSIFQGEGVPCRVTGYSEQAITNTTWIDTSDGAALVFSDDESGFGATDEGFASIPLPAAFPFDGKIYPAGTALNVHTNGFVSFDVIDVTNRPDTFNFFLEFAPDASTPNAAICPLWSDQLGASARTKSVTDAGTTTLVIEWSTTPFNAQSFGGVYQLQLVSSSNPSLNGMIRFLYRAPGGTSALAGALRDNDRLFVGVHSTGGLSVFRRDIPSLRTLVGSGADGVEFAPLPGDSPCIENVCTGDFDNDGDVDLGDFGFFGGAFDSVVGDANYDASADFDGDGDVDLGDFGAFGTDFARTDCLQ